MKRKKGIIRWPIRVWLIKSKLSSCMHKLKNYFIFDKETSGRIVTVEYDYSDYSDHGFCCSDKVLQLLIQSYVYYCKERGANRFIWIEDENASKEYKPKADEVLLRLAKWPPKNQRLYYDVCKHMKEWADGVNAELMSKDIGDDSGDAGILGR